MDIADFKIYNSHVSTIVFNTDGSFNCAFQFRTSGIGNLADELVQKITERVGDSAGNGRIPFILISGDPADIFDGYATGALQDGVPDLNVVAYASAFYPQG